MGEEEGVGPWGLRAHHWAWLWALLLPWLRALLLVLLSRPPPLLLLCCRPRGST